VKYVKVEGVLPDNLVREIQKYVQGEYLYIPCQAGNRKKWGEDSGNRAYLQDRNGNIRNKFNNGHKINDLAKEFFLSVNSIKKIIYESK